MTGEYCSSRCCRYSSLLPPESPDVVDDDATRNPIRDNPKGLKVGYNPYDSGSLGKTARIKKLDLRELSKWIDAKRKVEESGDPEK